MKMKLTGLALALWAWSGAASALHIDVVVGASGGKLTIASAPGKGTLIRAVFPARAANAQEA